MAEKKPQSLANHRRFVPMYHVVLFLILVVNLVWSAWHLYKQPGVAATMNLLVAFGLGILFLYARTFPLAAQDRLIRLEERLRLAEILPEDLKGRIGDLKEGHLIGLRFASDEEVPDLVRQVLDGKLKGREDIKKAIKNWRPDYYRV
ncbi:MAG: hypothetical protein GY769_23095 [bacterium]|nr:hypothetical protein [bacterium]